mgnify:CR=1 FL=1
MQNVDKHQVKAFLMALQDSICAELAAADAALLTDLLPDLDSIGYQVSDD